MKNTILLTFFALLLLSCSGNADSVVTVHFNGTYSTVSGVKANDSLDVSRMHGSVYIEHNARNTPVTIRLTGKAADAQFVLKTSTKDRIELDGVTVSSRQGAPIWIKNKKKVTLVALDSTVNSLTVLACRDTADNKPAVIHAKNKLALSGKGRLTCVAMGDGCRGISAKKDITIEDISLEVKTLGKSLGCKKMDFGPPMGPPPTHGGGPGAPPGMPKGDGFPFPGMGKEMVGPPKGERPDDADDGGEFKQKFVAACKGIRSKGRITIESGTVTVYTASAGAEGIEGKKGVEVNGGEVSINANGDAINADAAIHFNGGRVVALSRGNDAVDANPKEDFRDFLDDEDGEKRKKLKPCIYIDGGEVYAYSWVGAPEEGFDSDFCPLAVSGGTAFSIGAGMGGMPSVPTTKTAKQPTVLLVGLDMVKGDSILLKDEEGRVLFTVVAPFSYNNSSSILTCPDMKVGKAYVLECGDRKRSFIVDENFSVIR